MSNIPFDGWATGIAFQMESGYGAPSTLPVFTMPGKVAFALQPMWQQQKTSTNFWRQPDQDSFGSLFWQGSVECEMGLNQFAKFLLDLFFEPKATSAVGPLTQYKYRARRLAPILSGKFGIDFESGPTWLLHGVTLDSVQMTLKLNAAIRLKANFKCQRKENAVIGTIGESVIAQQILQNKPLTHFNASAAFNATPLAALVDLDIKFEDEKTLTRFDASQLAGLATSLGQLSITTEFQEYFNPASPFPDLVAAAAQGALNTLIADAVVGSSFAVNSPRALMALGSPDVIGTDDLVYRVTMDGRIDSSIADPEMEIILAI